MRDSGVQRQRLCRRRQLPDGPGVDGSRQHRIRTIVAAIRSVKQGARADSRTGLSVQTLRNLLTIKLEDGSIAPDTKVYVGDQGLNVAGSVFACILDGQRTVVIERKAEPGTPAAAPHDLF